MNITCNHIAYLNICHRKLWLFANGIQMEHSSEIVAEAKLIADTTYLDRARKYTEMEMEGRFEEWVASNKEIIHY